MKYCPGMEKAGLDLLEVFISIPFIYFHTHDSNNTQKMLKYNPADRISAKRAILHPYFEDMDA